MVDFISEIIHILEESEKVKGYWDDQGLDMHIAVTKSSVVVSTKHWLCVHYIRTGKSPEEMWKGMKEVSEDIGRTLIKSTKGLYVYIHKLNIEQTQKVFNKLKEKFGTRIMRVWEMGWDIDNATLPCCLLLINNKVTIDDIKGVSIRDNETYQVQDNTSLKNLVLSKTVLHAKKETRGHSHPGQEEVYFFIRGEGMMQIDEEKFSVKEKDIILIPDGAFHKVYNKSDTDLEFVCIFDGNRSH